MIQLDNVTLEYGKSTRVLNNVSFQLESGSFHFLTGPSGAGKTSIFKLMYMDLLPTAGNITLFGRNTKTLDRDEVSMMRRKMGLVFQDDNLLPHLTVRENVALPLSLHGPLKPEQTKCVDEILDWVGLSHRLDAYPGTLSGGEKQRASIARAVVARPKFLIADEPTGNVDDEMARRIMYLFAELNKHGTTVLIATHDAAILKSFPYPRLYLRGGNIIKKVPEQTVKRTA